MNMFMTWFSVCGAVACVAVILVAAANRSNKY